MKHNLENDIRDRMNQREIKPSQASWDRLDAMLAVDEKPKKSFGWIYIAASLVGIFLVATVFLKNSGEMIDVAKDPNHNSVVFVEANDSTKIEIPKEYVTETTERLAVAEKVKSNTQLTSKPTVKVLNNTEESVAGKTKDNQDLNQIDNNFKSETVELKSRISAEELLAAVENNSNQKVIQPNQNSIKVNSNSLLYHVDGEVELSFREKVIKTVAKNYQEVKLVISNRNQ